MRIDPKENILGVPILEIRDFLRREGAFSWGPGYLSASLKLSETLALEILEELGRRGLIEKKEFHDGEQYWERTLDGSTFASATAAKPVTRKTADKVFAEFMQRVQKVNTDPYYLYKVTSVVLFGSYLKDTPLLNDIDLALEVVAKETNLELHNKMRKRRIQDAINGGRQFNTYVAELGWPEREVWQYLKFRSPTLSLQPLTAELLELAMDYKVIHSET